MPKYKSLFKPSGRIGDLQFFESDGKSFIRQDGSLSRERIMSDAAFKRTRENMAEFGASAKAAAALRRSLASVLGTFKDKFVSSRLTKAMRGILSTDMGIRGQRRVSTSLQKSRLVGFEFNGNARFDGAFQGEYSVAVPAGRDSATLNIPVFNPDSVMSPPQGATHFRFILAIGVLSDYEFDPTTGKYFPVEPDLELLDANSASGYLSVFSVLAAPISLTAALPAAPAMSGDVSLMVTIGVEFYQQVGTVQYLLAQGNAMKIDSLH